MKRKNLLLVAGLVSVLSVANYGCKKDDDDDNKTVPPPTATMTCKVDGVDWSSLSNMAGFAMMSNTSNLTGKASDSSVVTVTVTEIVEEGLTYDLGPNGDGVGAYTAP